MTRDDWDTQAHIRAFHTLVKQGVYAPAWHGEDQVLLRHDDSLAAHSASPIGALRVGV